MTQKKKQWQSGGKDLLEVFPWPCWELTTKLDVQYLKRFPLQPHASTYRTRAVTDCLNEASCNLDIRWHEMTTSQECSKTDPKASRIVEIFYQLLFFSTKILVEDHGKPWNGRVGSRTIQTKYQREMSSKSCQILRCPKSQSQTIFPSKNSC